MDNETPHTPTSAPVAGEGEVLVPREPTSAMLAAMCRAEDAGSKRDEWIAALEAAPATPSPALPEGVVPPTHSERVEYEELILAAEMQTERLKRILKPFAAKADKWEANHAYHGSDSTQVTHRLGDFRAARTALKEINDEG